MAENLYLDRPGAEGVVSEINREIKALSEAAQNIDSCVLSKMPDYWRGASHTKLEQTYLSEYKDFMTNKVPAMVEQLKKYMQDCVQAIAEVDESL